MSMMDIRLLCVVIVSWIATCSSLTAIDDVINKARCRATCLAKFLKPDKVNSDVCEDNKICQTCWETCGLLYENYNVWDEMCFKKCRQGCKVACTFKQTQALSTVRLGNDSCEFAEKPVVMTDEELQQTLMLWSRPQPRVKLALESDQFVVYILMSRDTLHRNSTTNWTETLQTASTYAQIELNKLPYAPEFWLLAVNQNGTIAQLLFDSNYWTELSYERHDIHIPPINDDAIGVEASVEYDASSTLNVSMDIQVVDGEVKPTFMWNFPVIPGKIIQDYALHYFLDHCDCDLPQDHYEQSLRFENTDVNKTATFRLKKIAFSAQYQLILEMEDYKDKWYAKIRFYTPKCLEFVALEFSKCRTQATTSNQIAKGDADKVTTKLYSNNESITTRIKENTLATGQGKGNSINAPNDSHHLETTTTDEPEKWKLELVSREYQPEENAMIYNVTWSTVFNQSAVKYKLQVYDHKFKMVVDVKPVENRTYAIIEIPGWSNDTYYIHGLALYKTTSGETREITSNKLTVGVSSEDIHAKVLPIKKNLQAEEINIFNGIILGVCVVASIIILGIIVLFIYKKRQSFRDIIITKTTVAKSNSYKSNVGCKVDYSNQMLIVNDEWELDCSRLKFSSPLGQGAFGKVVTGFYGEKRVAIKLVRDSAPISYKEDLLAEINLMKRLGSHPNIVGMIGACTHMEPIALVMEYVPYGNLQNFLKKCRLDGELTKSGSQTELIYSLMDDEGGIDNGVIRPTDMLSFARQVAMAMEYLAEKKYVHRDLAARNILLGYDKIVKLCDFGLSRDVYNENQYKKLTNGKLPLKWMAIESLTDRVFTTQSDVWSFGILLWEIVTMGASPYPCIALADLYYVLSNGYRMEKPSNCSDELYIIMRQCWMEDPRDRPTFTDLRVQLEVLMTRDRNYLELYNINVPLSTPETSSASPVSDDTASLLAAQALQPARKSSKDELTVSVSVHDKSLDRLLKMKGDFDARCGVTVL